MVSKLSATACPYGPRTRQQGINSPLIHLVLLQILTPLSKRVILGLYHLLLHLPLLGADIFHLVLYLREEFVMLRHVEFLVRPFELVHAGSKEAELLV